MLGLLICFYLLGLGARLGSPPLNFFWGALSIFMGPIKIEGVELYFAYFALLQNDGPHKNGGGGLWGPT